MEIDRLLRNQHTTRPARQDVSSAVQRKLAGSPERQYGSVLAGLRDSARANSARKDGEDGGAGGGDAGGGGAPEVEAAPAAPVELPIVATIAATQTVRGGLAISRATTMGQMDPTYSFRNVTYEQKDGNLALVATMHCDYHWGLNPDPGPGMKDIVTGSEAFITADNYEDIANAIDPDLGTAPNKPTYFVGAQGYWSRAATQAHELEHARDDWADWAAPTTGVTIATQGFAAERIQTASIDAGVTGLLTLGGSGRHPGKIAAAVMAASDIHYGLPAAYMARPGEQKAHAVGAAIERPLAAAIRTHGKQLAITAQEAKAKEAEAAEGGASGGGAGGGGGAPAEAGRDSGARRGGAAADRTVDAIMSMFG